MSFINGYLGILRCINKPFSGKHIENIEKELKFSCMSAKPVYELQIPYTSPNKFYSAFGFLELQNLKKFATRTTL